MNIKEAHKIATTIVGYTQDEVEGAKSILLKSLDKLDKLEKENQELKEKLEKTTNGYFKTKKVLKILRNAFKFQLHETNKNRTGFEVYIGTPLWYSQLEKEEYEITEQVFESVADSDE